MKIRIIRRWTNIPMTDIDEEVYDIYHGFGFPISKFPFLTKWEINKVLIDVINKMIDTGSLK